MFIFFLFLCSSKSVEAFDAHKVMAFDAHKVMKLDRL